MKVMKQADVIALAERTLIPAWLTEREKQKILEDWAKGIHEPPYAPNQVNDEYKAIQRKSKVPLLGLVTKIFTQGLELTDYSPSNNAHKEPLWNVWLANRMQDRQGRLWRSALTGGLAYVLVLPGDPVPYYKIFSAKNMMAFYQDPEFDEWPMYAVEATPASKDKWHFNVYDEVAVYTLEMNPSGQGVKYIEHREHNLGVVPVIRFAGDMDDEGRATGEVEPLIPIQEAVDQSKFDLLMTESYGSFKIRYVTGMAKPETEEEARQAKLTLGQDRILISENADSKFGTLDGTDLGGYIEAGKASKQELATVAQISHKYVVGAQANTANGADAQVADEASTMRKLQDYSRSFGASIGQLNRLSGLVLGLEGAFGDYNGVVSWRDEAIRSLAQVADAVQKLSDEKLGIPREALWGMLPNVGADQIKQWKQMAASDPLSALLEGLDDDNTNAD